MFTFHIISLVSFLTGAWYSTHYTTWDRLGMMKKPRARLCKHHTALPQWVPWGQLCLQRCSHSNLPFVTWELCVLYLWDHTLPGNGWPVQWVLQKSSLVPCQVGTAAFTAEDVPVEKSFFVCACLGDQDCFSYVILFCKSHLHPGSWWVTCCSESLLIWCSTSEPFSVHLHSWFW